MKTFLKVIKKITKIILIIIFSVSVIYFVFSLIVKPQNNRNWNKDQEVLPIISIDKENISIKNIRNFSYKTTSDYTPNYYDKNFPRGSVKAVWFVVEPFSKPGLAHTFLSFEFENDEFLSISVEIRKEVGEAFDPIRGVLRNYELMYVIADEKDVIGLRANYRKDKVFLYPAKISKEKSNQLFEDMLTRAKELQDNPEFYNTINNTCTTNIVKHINSLSDNTIPFDMRILFPEDSDYYAYELGLIDTNKIKEEIRDYYQINSLAEKYKDDQSFSLKIRGR